MNPDDIGKTEEYDWCAACPPGSRRLPGGYVSGLIDELEALLDTERAQRRKAEKWNWRFIAGLAVAVWVGVWGWVKYFEAVKL